MNVVDEHVALDDAPILGPELADDGVVVFVDNPVPSRGFSARQVVGTSGVKPLETSASFRPGAWSAATWPAPQVAIDIKLAKLIH